ncbi:MAG: serine/threonine-protein kinase PknK, partial [Desulfobacterales bacterium]|nr:serine/threonine-protein kinase PknK [Desulfobacterales bacterium]
MSRTLECLHQGSTSNIFLDMDNMVVLKVLRSDLPGPRELAQLRNEWRIGRELNLSGCREVFDEIMVDGRPGLSMAYIRGRALKTVLADKNPGLRERLGLAVQVVAAVGELHGRGVIHKDINPGNVLVSDGDGAIKIIDFGLSTHARLRERHLASAEILEGTLRYISPEQTGRMNRVVDYRTDYYALGVMLYEMLTGRLPFEADDPTALIYAHIASPPIPPSKMNPSIGADLDAVILKLLSKNAEDRYRSAPGIIHDLEICMADPGAAKGFIPGRADRLNRFAIPATLYGRHADRQRLLEIFERAGRAGREMMLISGSAGVGKSALVYEIHQSVSGADACFISGKFDQYGRNTPYSAVIQAMEAFVRHALSVPRDRFKGIRNDVLDAVGKNGRVLTELVPDLEKIIGTQPEVPVLGSRESENRVRMVFRQFFAAISRPGQPLVLFLDDLQWADPASFELIRLLFRGKDDLRLFLIGAYRDNEVTQTHPLSGMAETLPEEGIDIHRITLGNLTEVDIQELVADTLSAERESAGTLAAMIFDKTLGNPFYARTLLETVHRDGLLVYSASENCWTWDMAAIRDRGYSKNVVDLLVERLDVLPRASLLLLQAGACIGNRFDINTLSIVCNLPMKAVLKDIWPVVAAGILEFADNGFKLLAVQADARSAVRFAHDRIRQAALSMMPEGERAKRHLTIGQLLLSDANDTLPGKRLFEVTDQMNLGERYLRDEERHTLAGLNLRAGKRAGAAMAYDAAMSYLETGLKMLGSAPWERDFHLALSLSTEAARFAYLGGDGDRVDAFSQDVLAHATALPQRMSIHLIQMEALIGRGQWLPSLAHAVSVLKLLDIRLPDPGDVDDDAIAAGLGKTADLLGGRQPEDLLDLSEMSDPAVLAAVEILTISLPASYIAAPQLFPLIVSKMVNLCLRFGNAPMSALAYANYGIVVSGVPGGAGLGYRYGQLALALLDRLDADAYKARTINNVNVFLMHWQAPLGETISQLEYTWDIGLQTGDLVFAGYSINARNYHAFFTGERLQDLGEKMKHYSRALAEIGQEGTVLWSEIHHQAVLNLSDPDLCPDPCRLAGPVYDTARVQTVHEQNNDMVGLLYIHLYRMILSYLFYDLAGAVTQSDRAKEYLPGASGMPLAPIYHFYDALIQLTRYGTETDDTGKQHIRERIQAAEDQLRIWSDTGKANYLHKYYLVRAEGWRIRPDEGQSREFYDKAVSLAQANGMVNEVALANELAGRYYLGRDFFQQARLYLNNALISYEQWGAKAKV